MALGFRFLTRNAAMKPQVTKPERVVTARMERLEGRELLSAAPAAWDTTTATKPVAGVEVGLHETKQRRNRNGSNRVINNTVSSQDVQWMNETASGNLLEIRLGNAAQTQGSAPIVKAFGMQMVEDHTLADETLRQIASRVGVTLPTTLNEEDRQTFDEITSLTGDQFDQAYATLMVQDHEDDIASYAREFIRTSNSRLKSFTNQTIPVLQDHLTFARVMDATVNGDNPLTDQDRQWISDAVSGNLLEIRLGEAALDQAANGMVKVFGARMVRDHTLANRILRSAAESLGVTVPTTLNAEDQQTFNEISNLRGTAFDQAYMSFMVEDHQDDVTSYRNEANSTGSDALRTYARQTLPVLQYHLALAEQVNTMVQPNTSTEDGGLIPRDTTTQDNGMGANRYEARIAPRIC